MEGPSSLIKDYKSVARIVAVDSSSHVDRTKGRDKRVQADHTLIVNWSSYPAKELVHRKKKKTAEKRYGYDYQSRTQPEYERLGLLGVEEVSSSSVARQRSPTII